MQLRQLLGQLILTLCIVEVLHTHCTRLQRWQWSRCRRGLQQVLTAHVEGFAHKTGHRAGHGAGRGAGGGTRHNGVQFAAGGEHGNFITHRFLRFLILPPIAWLACSAGAERALIVPCDDTRWRCCGWWRWGKRCAACILHIDDQILAINLARHCRWWPRLRQRRCCLLV